ncbi:unnamed protein product [Phytophthora lilii]|uniref:Unnamed protein product n=1 Tax=Phytophthora lilii TaxID=2077276 RepID=A0A9W6TWU9_9STRA|nr:unnamed protein product [Phytophthora lilii]
MGCVQSSTNNQLRISGLVFSVTELSIAKRPGGPDVGPIRASPGKVERLSGGSTPGESDAESELAAKPKRLPVGVIVFSVVKVIANEDGVIFYVFSGTSSEEPTNEVIISKRFSNFKALHTQISELMANERNVPLDQQHLFETHPALPELPQSNAWTYLRGRSNEKLLEEREEQFTRILNAISRHPVAFQSKPFTDFLLA